LQTLNNMEEPTTTHYNAVECNRSDSRDNLMYPTEAIMRFSRICFAVSIVAASCFAAAQAMPKMAPKKAGSSDASYTAKSLSAAPKSIAKDAGVARYDKDGKMQALRQSKNGFTCMVILGDAMCADANSMAFFDAMMKKQNPPDKLGLTYMLGGDNGASNTDPTAVKKTAVRLSPNNLRGQELWPRAD